MAKQIIKYFTFGLLAAFLIVFARFTMNRLIVCVSCGIVFFIAGALVKKKLNASNSILPILSFLSFPLFVLIYSSFSNFPFIIFWITEALLVLVSFFIGYKYAENLFIKKLIAICCIFLFSLLVHFLLTPFARYTASKIQSKKGDTIISKKTNFWFINKKGDTLNQANYNGSIVLIDYWFIGCKPCYEKMQALAELRSIYKNNESVIIIAIDAATSDSYNEFLAESKLLPKDLIYGYDTTFETKNKFKLNGYPTEILINQKGYVEHYLTGFNPDYKQQYINDTKNKINALLQKN